MTAYDWRKADADFAKAWDAALEAGTDVLEDIAAPNVVIEAWRRLSNTLRPHSSLAYRPPAPEVQLWPAALPRPAPPATPTVAL